MVKILVLILLMAANAFGVADSNLIAWYKMDDNADSNVVLDSAGANNGTFVGTDANTSAHSVIGKANRALIFDGTADYVDCGNVCNVGTGNFSLAAWLKTSDTAGGIIAKGAKYRSYVAGGKIIGSVNDGVNSASRNGDLNVSQNKQHFVVITFDKSKANGITTYIDGAVNQGSQSGDLTAVGNLDSADSLILARSGAVPGRLAGVLDNAMIFNRALTASEVKNLYKRVMYKGKYCCSGKY